MRLRAPAIGLVALALVALPARGDAPIDQYDPYDVGDQEITDRHTGLHWERYAENAHGGSQTNFMGASCSGGARLPTVKELLTLVDEAPHQALIGGKETTRWIDRYAFTTARPEPYWTSSAADANNVWVVDFGQGTSTPLPRASTAWVRCVR